MWTYSNKFCLTVYKSLRWYIFLTFTFASPDCFAFWRGWIILSSIVVINLEYHENLLGKTTKLFHLKCLFSVFVHEFKFSEHMAFLQHNISVLGFILTALQHLQTKVGRQNIWHVWFTSWINFSLQADWAHLAQTQLDLLFYSTLQYDCCVLDFSCMYES